MANGIEIMLRSMGLNGAIEQAKALAEAGALQRIVTFADQLDAHTRAINRLADILEGGDYVGTERGSLCRTVISGSGSDDNGTDDGNSGYPFEATGTD